MVLRMSEKIHLTFTVDGRVVPAVRTTRRQQFSDPYYARYRDYKEYFATVAKQALSKRPSFYCDRGTTVEFDAVAYLRGRRRIDVDNVLKCMFDSCNNILWYDDSQVIKATIEKVIVKKEENERVEVVVTRETP
jgi:crossover junction endodeoxyribonuclease RusA